MPDIYQRLGQRVRQERLRLGWTQEELAEKADLHAAYIGQIERTQKKVSLATVDRLATALEVGIGFLLSQEERSYRPSNWETRINGLLKGKSLSEKGALYRTLKGFAKEIRSIR
ncbi:MAG: helix-turn-helix transcriptional regulator [Elusimicrobia bacterium]|nr:helix-turn-helix transcriptional regulator [Elusimicrobiota bacterium]